MEAVDGSTGFELGRYLPPACNTWTTGLAKDDGIVRILSPFESVMPVIALAPTILTMAFSTSAPLSPSMTVTVRDRRGAKLQVQLIASWTLTYFNLAIF